MNIKYLERIIFYSIYILFFSDVKWQLKCLTLILNVQSRKHLNLIPYYLFNQILVK